jgi:hypothetical protein
MTRDPRTRVNEVMTESTVIKDKIDNPDPNYCDTCGDHVEDHRRGGGACEMGDCKCRLFVPESAK